jgi:hypothetical protein
MAYTDEDVLCDARVVEVLDAAYCARKLKLISCVQGPRLSEWIPHTHILELSAEGLAVIVARPASVAASLSQAPRRGDRTTALLLSCHGDYFMLPDPSVARKKFVR